MDPQQTGYYVAPYAEGQSGIPFGGGMFTWPGSGWHDPATGRRWDAGYNVVQPQQTTPGLAAQQSYANPLVDFFTTHSGIDVSAYNWGKLKSSTRDLALAA